MNKPILLTFIVFALVNSRFVVYGEPQPPPTPPFLSPMPDNSTWDIKVSRQSDAQIPKGARTVDQTITTKSGSKRQCVSVWSDGSRTEVWFVEGVRIEQPIATGSVLLTPAVLGRGTQTDDFPDLGWLDLSNYAGIVQFKSQNCYKFDRQVILEKPPLVLQFHAYISTKTKEPVAWDVGPSHFELISTSPASLSPMPPAFVQSLKEYEEASTSPNAYARKAP